MAFAYLALGVERTKTPLVTQPVIQASTILKEAQEVGRTIIQINCAGNSGTSPSRARHADKSYCSNLPGNCFPNCTRFDSDELSKAANANYGPPRTHHGAQRCNGTIRALAKTDRSRLAPGSRECYVTRTW